jgi:hypothetical protein
MSAVSPVVGLQVAAALQRVPAAVAFERAAREPAAAQEALLARIMRDNAGTELARKYGLGEVRTRKQLQERMPIVTYDDLRPYIDRQMQGEPNILTREAPIFFATSTGTTGVPKRVPMTPTFRRDFQRTVHVSMWHVMRRFPRAFTGNVAYAVAPPTVERAPCGTPIGFTSGFNQSTLPPLVRRLFAWPYEMAEVKDGATRGYLAVWLTALSRVTMMTGVFPLAITNFLRLAEQVAEPLARDLRRGTLREDLALSPAERAFFAKYARADAKLADRIEQMTKDAGGKMPLRAILPDLRLVYCWTTASASSYVPELKRRLGDGVAVRDAIYAANEGWGNVTFGDDLPGGPAALTSHVYEYIEVGAWERGDRVGVGVEDLVPGKQYRALVTTSAGLFRYDTADLVECTRMYHATPCIHFVRRHGATFNVAGEKLDEVHVIGAVTKALEKERLAAPFFTAVPQFTPTPHWAFAVELSDDASDDRLEALRASLETELGRVNEDYVYQRSRTLSPIVLHVIARGESDRVRRELLARGRPEAQLKTVHLLTDPDALGTWRIERRIEAPARA